MSNITENLYSAMDAAVELGMSYARTLDLVRKGEIESEQFGRSVMITKEALEAFRTAHPEKVTRKYRVVRKEK